MSGFRRNAAILLVATVFFSVLTVWMQNRWSFSAAQVCIFVLTAAFALQLALRPFPLRGSVLLIPLLGAVLWGLFQLYLGISVYPFATWDAILSFGAYFCLFGVSLQIFDSAAVRHGMRLSLIYFGFAVSIFAILQLFSNNGRVFWLFQTPYEEPMGPFLNRDHYSAWIELLLPLAIWQAIVDRPKALFYSVIAATMFASVIAGASRAGSILVSLEILVLMIPVLSGRKGPVVPVQTAVFTGMILLIVAFSAVVGWEVLFARFGAVDPFAYRREFLQTSLMMIRQKPLLGFGLGTWPTVYPGYAVFDAVTFANHAHCDWAEWTADGTSRFGDAADGCRQERVAS